MNTQAGPKPIQIRKPVFIAMTDWLQRTKATADAADEVTVYPAAETILHHIPQREQPISADEGRLHLPYFEAPAFRTTLWQSLRRLLTWLTVLLTLLFGNLTDRLRRRDTVERRAARLRRELERAGGTFVKLGQQAAMRIDLIPWAYCVELSRMLDRMPPFPVEQALKTIERDLKRPWQEVFEVFDPVPVGSASIACIYQATLKGGAKVVVKIRRPGIAELFLADLRVLDWISKLAEFFTFLRPGFTRNLRTELRETLLEELDFRREGRFQDIFRRNSRKSGRSFFTAPRVYFELSGDEVLVQEFVSGLWLWEVISIVEQRDPAGRALLRDLNIDPALVARRITWAAFWSMDEHLFFHADPHPANILVCPNSELIFVDFGSCGSFNNQQRIALEQMVLGMKNQDVESMTRGLLSLLEPMPAVDMPALVKEAQEEYMRVLHTFNTPAIYTQYWERTSARQWIVMISLARKFKVPLNLHTLRMIRATLLYDTIVLRLDNQLDRYHEYMLFMKDRARLIKLRWRERLRDNSGDSFFLNIEEFGQTLDDLLIRTQATLSRPLLNFGSTVDKWIFAVSVFSRLLGRILIVTILLVALVNLWQYVTGTAVAWSSALSLVAQNRVYQLALLAGLLISLRQIAFRFRDRDAS
jgi:predicted unusual protein kinase regulating ubiquinone biosynthesis (AarF/ABC1/UbiB family)